MRLVVGSAHVSIIAKFSRAKKIVAVRFIEPALLDDEGEYEEPMVVEE